MKSKANDDYRQIMINSKQNWNPKTLCLVVVWKICFPSWFSKLTFKLWNSKLKTWQISLSNPCQSVCKLKIFAYPHIWHKIFRLSELLANIQIVSWILSGYSPFCDVYLVSGVFSGTHWMDTINWMLFTENYPKEISIRIFFDPQKAVWQEWKVWKWKICTRRIWKSKRIIFDFLSTQSFTENLNPKPGSKAWIFSQKGQSPVTVQVASTMPIKMQDQLFLCIDSRDRHLQMICSASDFVSSLSVYFVHPLEFCKLFDQNSPTQSFVEKKSVGLG